MEVDLPVLPFSNCAKGIPSNRVSSLSSRTLICAGDESSRNQNRVSKDSCKVNRQKKDLVSLNPFD